MGFKVIGKLTMYSLNQKQHATYYLKKEQIKS